MISLSFGVGKDYVPAYSTHTRIQTLTHKKQMASEDYALSATCIIMSTSVSVFGRSLCNLFDVGRSGVST